MRAPVRRPRRALTLIASVIVSLAALLGLPQAHVQAAQKPAAKQNRTTVKLLPTAAKRLGARNVRLISTGLARGRGNEIWSPVLAGKINRARAQLRQGGGFEIRVRRPGRRARALRLGRLELRLGKAPALLARPVGTRATIRFFNLRYRPRALNLRPTTRTARLRNARLIPTPRAIRILRRRLGLPRVKRLPLAALTTTVDLRAFDLPPVPPEPLKPLPPEPQRLARPASAVDVSSAEIIWCVRASWIRYMNSEGAPVVSGGAFPIGPPVTGEQACDQETTKPTSAPLHYMYGFQPRGEAAGGPGWYDPVGKQAALYFVGGVRFRYRERGIDLQFNDPEIELAGEDSRQIFRFVGGDDTEIPSHRVVLADLDGGAAANLIENPAGVFATTELHAAFTATAVESVFAGLYPVGGPAGWVKVKFEIPPTQDT